MYMAYQTQTQSHPTVSSSLLAGWMAVQYLRLHGGTQKPGIAKFAPAFPLLCFLIATRNWNNTR